MKRTDRRAEQAPKTVRMKDGRTVTLGTSYTPGSVTVLAPSSRAMETHKKAHATTKATIRRHRKELLGEA